MINRDLFGNEIMDENLTVKVNIYADESMNRKCPDTGDIWHYICIIVENIEKPLLEDIKKERYLNNFDYNSEYYYKNNHIIHWKDINSADKMNICKRWFNYILNPDKSKEKFFCYILGLNETLLNRENFDRDNLFNSIYQRFFRTTIEYALKCFFPKKKWEICNIFHEQGQQQYYKHFPTSTIYKLCDKVPDKLDHITQEIEFLEKDHKKNEKANILQLCDCFLGACVNLLHGIIKKDSNSSEYKIKLMEMIIDLLCMMMKEPTKKDSPYEHANRIMIRFFPRKKTLNDDFYGYENLFYTERSIKYLEEKNGQKYLDLNF